MIINKLIIGTIILASFSLTACSGDNSDSSQSANNPTDKNSELRDAVKSPMEKAQGVEKTIMDKAAKDAKAMSDAEHAAHH